jgi:hypothetical protein
LSPGRLGDVAREGFDAPRHLGVGEEQRLLRGQVGRERLVELVPVEEDSPASGAKAQT